MASTRVSSGSIARKMEWVCLFDFRCIPEEKKSHVFDSFAAPFCRNRNYYLVFKKAIFEKLILQKSKHIQVRIGQSIDEENELLKIGGTFIHYGESWHNGDILVEYIESVIIINFK